MPRSTSAIRFGTGAPPWWGDCPWHGSTTFINRSNLSSLSYRDIPAARRFIDGTQFDGETTSDSDAPAEVYAPKRVRLFRR